MQVHRAIRRATMFIGMAAALTLGIASQAAATTVNITYTGSVTNGDDQLGVFGSSGASLTGAAYKLVFTVDSTVGSYSTIVDPLFSGDQIFGGISATMTINGHTHVFAGVGGPGGNFDIVATKPGFGEFGQQFAVSGPSTLDEVLMGLTSTNPGVGFPTSVYTGFALSSCPAGSCTAGGMLQIASAGHSTFARLGFGSVVSAIAPIATTPLPASLPLLISALGGLGLVGWKRRNAEAA